MSFHHIDEGYEKVWQRGTGVAYWVCRAFSSDNGSGIEIITKTDTLNLIEKIEEPKEEVVEEEVDSTVEAVTDTNNNNTILYVGIGVVVVLVAAFFIMKAKK